MRKGKLLLALAAVKGARAASATGNPDAHRITVRFAQAVHAATHVTEVCTRLCLFDVKFGSLSPVQYPVRPTAKASINHFIELCLIAESSWTGSS